VGIPGASNKRKEARSQKEGLSSRHIAEPVCHG